MATAMDGQDCLATVSAIVPDVITLEEMPRLDAWKTAIRFRKCPGNSRIRLVLIPPRVPEGDRTRRGRVSADAYLVKPFTITR